MAIIVLSDLWQSQKNKSNFVDRKNGIYTDRNVYSSVYETMKLVCNFEKESIDGFAEKDFYSLAEIEEIRVKIKSIRLLNKLCC